MPPSAPFSSSWPSASDPPPELEVRHPGRCTCRQSVPPALSSRLFLPAEIHPGPLAATTVALAVNDQRARPARVELGELCERLFSAAMRALGAVAAQDGRLHVLNGHGWLPGKALTSAAADLACGPSLCVKVAVNDAVRDARAVLRAGDEVEGTGGVCGRPEPMGLIPLVQSGELSPPARRGPMHQPSRK